MDEELDLPLTLSERLWRFRWADVTPREVAPGIHLERCDERTFLRVFDQHFAHEISSRNGFVTEVHRDARRSFLKEYADSFLFRAKGEPIGYALSNPLDWASYYARSAAVMPLYRGRNLLAAFLEFLAETLAPRGVTRLVADTHPTNTPVLKITQRQGYVVTGQFVSERWGAMVQLTRFLESECRAIFENKFVPAEAFAPENAPERREPNRREVSR